MEIYMEKNINKKSTLGMGIKAAFSAELEKRRTRPGHLIKDVLVFALCFVFARFHLFFGAYPLATAYIAAAPTNVWVALLGAVFGALSLGGGGVIHAMISIIVVFLRVLISGGESKDGEGRVMFSEPVVLRISASLIGAFIGAVYELLLGGIDGTAILYGLASCLFSAGFTFAFYGLFSADVSFFDVFFARSAVFERKREARERYNIIFFQFAFLLLVFLVSLASAEYNIFGINLDFVFAGVVALFVAKRFGAVRGMAAGFAASLGISSSYSVAYALLGLASGLLFPLGYAYALLGGGALLAAWSAYSGGLVGFLSTLPEYAASTAIFFPFARLLSTEKKEEVREDKRRVAADMVAAMALSHRNERGGEVDKLSESVANLASSLRRFGKSEGRLSSDEVRAFLRSGFKDGCRTCPYLDDCLKITPAPCIEIIDEMTTRVYKDDRMTRSCTSLLPDYCKNREYIIDYLAEGFGVYSMNKYKSRNISSMAEEYELMAKLINEARLAEEREYSFDKEGTDALTPALVDAGLEGAVIRSYGDRKKRFIIAGEDEDGALISSRKLYDGISKITGLGTGAPEYYRKGTTALADFMAAPVYAVDFAKASLAMDGSSESGDVAISFTSEGHYFYALLSDGMGSGECARETASFVSDFLSNMLTASISEGSALGALNHIVKRRENECSATVDLFRFDLLRGEAIFVKSGAAASYVKRGDSLFRIRSESLPLGISRTVDAEKIRVECREGDLVVMLSDGITDAPDTVPWLAEFLSKPENSTLGEYADSILSLARKNSRTRDDMTVVLAKIRRIA